MTADRDDATLRRYREASAALDERPSDETHAAILAAAARRVNARPMSADAPRAPVRRRWPLAAAATVLLSTLAVMLATRTEQEMPVFTAPAERANERVAAAPPAPEPSASSAAADRLEQNAQVAAGQKQQLDAPSTVAPAAPPPAGAPVPAAKPDVGRLTRSSGADSNVAPAPEVEGKLNKSVATAREGDRPQSAPAKPADEGQALGAAAEPPARAKVQSGGAREPETQEREARRAFPGAAGGALATAPSAPATSSSPSAPAASPPAPVTAPAPSQAGRDIAASSDSAKREQFSHERARQDAAGPVLQGTVREEAAPKDYERTAEAWIDHIVRLRRDGRHDEADAELKRLRERFPEARVPPTALPPTGTR